MDPIDIGATLNLAEGAEPPAGAEQAIGTLVAAATCDSYTIQWPDAGDECAQDPDCGGMSAYILNNGEEAPGHETSEPWVTWVHQTGRVQ